MRRALALLILSALVGCKKEPIPPANPWFSLDPEPAEMALDLEHEDCTRRPLGLDDIETEIVNISDRSLHLTSTAIDLPTVEAQGGVSVIATFREDDGFVTQTQVLAGDSVVVRLDARVTCAENEEGVLVPPAAGVVETEVELDIIACPGSAFCEDPTDPIGVQASPVLLTIRGLPDPV